MERITFKLKLKEGFEKEYEKRHNPVWPELESLFLENGVEEYSIFLDENTNELLGVIHVESKAQWKRIIETEIVTKWRKYMEAFYETNGDGTPKIKRLKEIFHIKKE